MQLYSDFFKKIPLTENFFEGYYVTEDYGKTPLFIIKVFIITDVCEWIQVCLKDSGLHIFPVVASLAQLLPFCNGKGLEGCAFSG